MIAEPGSIVPARAERPLAVALDVGSSSVRASLHDRRGRALRGTTVRVPYAWDVSPDGGVRLPHQTLLGLVGRVLDEMATLAAPYGTEIVAAGVSCFIHSIVGLDASGEPVTQVLSWADTSSAAEAAALRERLDPVAVHAVTGAPLHAGYWPARMLRLRREQPSIRRWAGLPELLAEALTGRLVISRSMASGTGLLDRAAGAWWASLVTAVEADPGDLPAVLDDGVPIGGLAGVAAARWRPLAHLEWYAAWGDGGCSNVGLAACGPESAALMVGTSGALRAMVADPAPTLPIGLFAHRLGGGTIVGGQLSEGGGLLAWASALLNRSGATLERAAASLDPDGHGLTVLPYTFGERGLGYHDAARGALVGLRPDTDAAAVYRAIVESIAGSFAAVDDRLHVVLGRTPAIVASGGALEHSPLLVQVLADSLGRDLDVATGVEASVRGAALLALQGVGALDDVRTVPGPPTRVVRHDAGRTERYVAARARRDAVYETILG